MTFIPKNLSQKIERSLSFYGTVLGLIMLTLNWIYTKKYFLTNVLDAEDYIDYSYALGLSWKRVFNDYRAPVFPTILQILGIEDITSSLGPLYLVHSIMFVVTIIITAKIAELILKSRWSKIILVTSYSTAFQVIWFTKTVLSEITTLFFLSLFVYLTILLIKNPNLKKTALTSVTLLLTVFTRPFNLYLIIPISALLLAFTLKDYKNKMGHKYIMPAFIMLLIIFTFSFTYSSVNKYRYKYFGVSIEGGANLFARVAKNPGWLPETDEEFPEILQRAKTCAPDKIDFFTCQWPLVPAVNPLPEYKGSLGWERDDSYIHKVESFSKKYILNNFGKYSLESMQASYQSLNKVYIDQNFINNISNVGFRKLVETAVVYSKVLHLFSIPAIFAIGVLTIKDYFFTGNKNVKNKIILLLGIIVFYYLIITGYVAAGDFWRMIIPIVPFLYIINFYAFDVLVIKAKKNVRKA